MEKNWYEKDKTRLVFEFLKMRKIYPQFILIKNEDKLIWEGEVNNIPDGIKAVPLKVQLIYPYGYPIDAIEVKPLFPDIPLEVWGHKWHRYPKGNICYIKYSDWILYYNAIDVVDKIEKWYFNYLALKNNLITAMPDIGFANILLSEDKGAV